MFQWVENKRVIKWHSRRLFTYDTVAVLIPLQPRLICIFDKVMKDKKHTSDIQVSTAPAVGQQPIKAGAQVIMRPTTNTSTESSLKEGKS